MSYINENFLELQDSYLFSTIAKKVAEYTKNNPEKEVIKLGIGDVTKPIVPACIEAMHKAVDEIGTQEGFKGYGPEQGYDFLRKAIVENDYKARNIDISEDEIFVSINHSMTREHHISFIAYITQDRTDLVKLYPEGNAETRFFNRGSGYILWYCNHHGLFRRRFSRRP